MSHSTLLSADRLRDVLAHIRERGLELDVCPAQDIPGPGGGVYITKQTPLTDKHLEWLESRSPSDEQASFVEVRWVHRTRGDVAPPPMAPVGEDEPDLGAALEKTARQHSRRVGRAAREVADKASGIYRSLGKADFSVEDLRKADPQESLRQFEASFIEFHGAVKKAIGEYLRGNTLVMDLILKFELDRDTVRHALSVAAFATEMASQLAMRQSDAEGMGSYFGDATDTQIMDDLGIADEDRHDLSHDDLRTLRAQLFREELVEIFLGGFMHDCGLWTEPFFLPEGHEVKGAKLISETTEVQKHAPSLAKIVLFHSDIVRLARKHGLVKITESPDDAKRLNYRREFYDERDDAGAAAELYSGNARAEVLSLSDLRKVLPVALAEHYISQTRDIYTKPEVEVITDLATHVRGGPFQRYMAVLCNSRVEVVAPRRALVRLDGHMSVMVEGRKDSRRAVRLEVDGYDAGSLYHGKDRNSPHLITLFLSRGDGSRVKAEYVNPREHALWERAAGIDSRMYIAAGRYRNNLSFRVTGFMSEEVFERVLGEYEQEFHRRQG